LPKIKAAIIGSGNIGTDLMFKAIRSDVIEPAWMVGIDPESQGLALAKEHGLQITNAGIDGMLPHVRSDEIRIAFDATSAHAHPEHAGKLQPLDVRVIDLTPAAIGPYCVPVVDLEKHLGREEMNINMVSCGGQATIPIVAAISETQDVEYAEIVATIASRSAGPGTRRNIDEFTRATARGLEVVGGAAKGKAIIILNPAEPPLIMRDTVHCLTREAPREAEIGRAIAAMIHRVQAYVPGYRLKNGPVFDGNRVSVFLEVQGLGDYLPPYAGNLDIMTSAALRTAEIIGATMRGRHA